MGLSPVGWLFAIAATAIGFLITATSYASRSAKVINLQDPMIKQWEPYVRPAAIQHHVDPGVAMFWLAIESGGNICEVGERTARGPDGSPKEIGLFQLYNPDDFARLRANASDLRAYCVKPEPGQPDPQKLSRQPTEAEKAQHIGLGIALILRCMSVAAHYMTLAGITWNVGTADFWKATKLVHALPVIVSQGFLAVAHKLDHPPATWDEFRTAYETIQPRAKFDPSKPRDKQDGYWRALENAEQTGNHFEGASVA